MSHKEDIIPEGCSLQSQSLRNQHQDSLLALPSHERPKIFPVSEGALNTPPTEILEPRKDLFDARINTDNADYKVEHATPIAGYQLDDDIPAESATNQRSVETAESKFWGINQTLHALSGAGRVDIFHKPLVSGDLPLVSDMMLNAAQKWFARKKIHHKRGILLNRQTPVRKEVRTWGDGDWGCDWEACSDDMESLKLLGIELGHASGNWEEQYRDEINMGKLQNRCYRQSSLRMSWTVIADE